MAQVRAYLFPDADNEPGYQTQWVSINVDPNGDGAASSDIGPGAANLLTGDYQLSATDVDEFGMSVSRVASSREPAGGWIAQGERLTGNQQQISTDLTGFTVGNATVTRSTSRGHGGTTESLAVAPLASGGTGTGPQGDTFAGIENQGSMTLAMKAGRRYRATGWIYVPASTGLNTTATMGASRGLRIVGFYKDGANYFEVASPKASYVEGWQQLSVDLVLPATATEAFFRLYNGFPVGQSGKVVYWDNLSVREIVAPFGPQWRGGVADGPAGSEFTSLEFPAPDFAVINAAGGGQLTFAKSLSGTFFPEPGAESLTLTNIDSVTYQLKDITDGTVVEFKQQTGSAKFVVTSTWTVDTASTTRYVYDLSDNRALVKRVINPTEPGVGDCTTAIPARGCEVLEYDYATATTATASAFGDVKDQVRAVRAWSWDPTKSAMNTVDVARYLYDQQGRLRQAWDPRIGPGKTNVALNKTATGSTPCSAEQGPAKAVNGTIIDVYDKWCSLTSPRWLQVDLGTTQTLTSFVVRHAGAGGESSLWNTRDYNIQVSTDGSAWTTVVSVTGNIADVTTHSIPAATARHVRLNVITPETSGNGAARIFEFEAYADTGSATPLKTGYEYDSAGRVTKVTPAGELPWMADYGNADVDVPVLRWDLDEGSGTTTADTSGRGNTGTLAGGLRWDYGNNTTNIGDKAAGYSMTSGQQVSTSGPVLDTSTSFTVSAWVNLTDTSDWRNALTQDGTQNFGFQLGYDTVAGRWGFAMTSADVAAPSADRARSQDPPALGAWTHLTGVYDASAGQIRLYVNGQLQATTAHTNAWNAGGPFVVGRAKWGGVLKDWWSGGIDDVRAYQKVLTDEQITILAGDDHPGRLHRVRRAALQQGSKDVTDGEVATRLVYNVPLTRGTGGPHDMAYAWVSGWGQKDAPTDATAIFPPEQDPTVVNASPTTPGPDGYNLASIYYLNANGQQVNTATPGGYIDSQQYDNFGNVVWTLEATNRMVALGTHPQAADYAAQLNLPPGSADRANLLATVNTYSSDGLDLTETLAPVTRTVLERDLVDPGGVLATIPAGSAVVGRGHSVNTYDEGKPDGATYHLITTETSGARIDGWPVDADVRVEQNFYAAEKGGTSGWVLKTPTKVVADAGTGGMALTSYVVYDSAGRATESWGIGATGTDYQTVKTIYYTAGANSQDATCGNKPEWAGQPCLTKTAGAPTGAPVGVPADSMWRKVERYSRWGEAEQTVEEFSGKTRTTTTSYDDADRVLSVQITSDDGTTQIPAVSTVYDPATGQITQTTAGSATITREYDQLGRLYRYTDADGGLTTNEFDRFGKPSKVSDNTGWSTFTYDRSIDPRGLLTSVTDSVAGTFGARYSPDGQLVELQYPGGLTRKDTLDANFTPVQRVYTRDSDATAIYAESIVENSAGQWVNHTYTGGSKTYGYDRIGRLTSTKQVDAAGQCTTRTYSYTARTNREHKRTWQPGAGGECRSDGTPDAEDGHTYDSADRLVDPGYSYDEFGRITATPGGMAISYYANDLVATQQLGDTRQNWTLDPKHRFRGYTTETNVSGSWVNASSKLNHYGDDSDEPRWIIEDTTLGSITRNVSGPDADLVATTSATGDVRLQLTNLHGDVAATIDTTLTTPEFYSYDEFGIPAAGQADQRYGWLGGKQRSGEALGDIILMGVRLYSPALGRFLQPDPVDGGNSNSYDYCSADPVNCTDLDGQWGWGSIKKALNKVARVASYASMIPGPIGTFAGVVSAVSYAATGNWKEAAWAVAGAAAAVVGAGAAVRGARLAVTAIRASSKGGRLASWGGKAVSRTRGFFSRCNSFTPDTPVLMADGTYLPISAIEVGDWVTAQDPSTGQPVPQPVLAVFVGQGTKHLFDIDLDGNLTDTLTATAEHPIWVDGKGWTFARDIRAGDVIATDSDLAAPVRQVIDRGWIASSTVYNLNIGDIHTYIVAVDGVRILVHNASCPVGSGRSGKSTRLRELANDDKVAKHLRGWIKNQLRQGRAKLPPGYQLAHYRTHESARGCSYRCSQLQLRSLHRLQHKYDRNGRRLRGMRKIVR